MFFSFILILGYATKPQEKEIIKEVKTHACEDIQAFDNQQICIISEACTKGGGQLLSYRNRQWHGPEFNCKYK